MRSKAVEARSRVLRGMRKLAHRYDHVRLAAQGATLGILLLVPLSGLVCLDVWRGEHRLFFAPAAFNVALAGVITGIAATYVVTFLSNVVAGRLFCGWGCPVGQLGRFGDAIDAARSPRARHLQELAGAAYGATLSLSLLAWWVDLRVLLLGSGRELALAWGLLALGAAVSWAHARFVRWEFCRKACPIGAYYSLVSPAKWFGVHFRNAAETCIECRACDQVCPVGLAPRDLGKPIPAPGGLAVGDAPGRNHCLECGDCVRACEWVLAKTAASPIPLRLGRYNGAPSDAAFASARPRPVRVPTRDGHRAA